MEDQRGGSYGAGEDPPRSGFLIEKLIHPSTRVPVGKKEYTTTRGISIALGRIANEAEANHCVRYESYGRLVTLSEAIAHFQDDSVVADVKEKYKRLRRKIKKTVESLKLIKFV